jgi:enamidase
MSSVLLKNIGTIVSGNINAPILEGNAILVEDGKIQKVGSESALNVAAADMTIDCAGTTVTPGLFDSHCHVVLGD